MAAWSINVFTLFPTTRDQQSILTKGFNFTGHLACTNMEDFEWNEDFGYPSSSLSFSTTTMDYTIATLECNGMFGTRTL
jgi:hypothetical protein